MKVGEKKVDAVLAKLLRAKPQARQKIKTQGKRGRKTAMLSQASSEIGNS